MLADHYSTLIDESLGCFSFESWVWPWAYELNLHCYAWTYASCTKIVRCHTGDDFCKWECADITDYCFFCLDLSFIDELLELETCCNTCNISSFVDSCECVICVVSAVCLRSTVCKGYKLDIWELISCLLHILLETIGVVEDDFASFGSETEVGIDTACILVDVSLYRKDNIVAVSLKLIHSCVHTIHEVISITLVVFASNYDKTDLCGFLLCWGFTGALCKQREAHEKSECDSKCFFHCFLLFSAFRLK